MTFFASKLRTFIITSGLICCALACWAFWLEPSGFRIRNETLSIPEWPRACEGLRIAVLADLHVGSPYHGLKQLEELVSQVNAAQPDLILLPGDFVIHGVVGGAFVAPEDSASTLSALSAPLGSYAVLGNHDWWFDPVRIENALLANGIGVLEDRSVVLETTGCRFNLTGISDYTEGPLNLVRAFDGLAADDTIVVFTHNPDVFPTLSSLADLTIAGHTHGGQVYIPGIGRPIVPSEFGERYAIGHIVENGRHLYVSSGVGTSILPVRFLVPPEVTMLTVNSD